MLLAADTQSAQARVPDEEVSEDEPLAAFQEDLLSLGFRAASSLPTLPHVKNRCRLQESVAITSLKLGQPRRALEYFEEIDNWRRGVGLADVALANAKAGNVGEAERLVELALKVADAPEDEGTQTWRRDRIRARAACALLVLGESERAARLERAIDTSESGRIRGYRATLEENEEVDRRVEGFSKLTNSDEFDVLVDALARGPLVARATCSATST